PSRIATRRQRAERVERERIGGGGHHGLLVRFARPGRAAGALGLVSQDPTGALVRDTSARAAVRSSHSAAAVSSAATSALSASALTRPPSGTSATSRAATASRLAFAAPV